ncbi:TIGR03086 family protein [Candidatus Saccharibacteria bacterium]|nr:MAG: TIGR03086 family protein [Candidatus Saccharibacteria bacterium]
MKPKKDFLYALDQVREVVIRLLPEQLSLSTPDTEWDVRALLGHMLYELVWVPDIVAGQTIESVGSRHEGDLLGKNPIGAWRKAAVAASEAVRRCDPREMAHLSYGDTRIAHYLQEAATDQLVHAWDLGKAIGVEVQFDETLAHEIFERMDAKRESLAASGLFAEPIDVGDDAHIQTRLLALLGRRSDWQAN